MYRKLTFIYLITSILALITFIISMSFFGAEGFHWFGGFTQMSDKAQNSIAINNYSLIVVGIGLSIAGVAMQGVTRNNLASAYSLGSIASAMLALILVEKLMGFSNPAAIISLTILVSTVLSSIFLIITFSPKVNPTKVIIIGMVFSVFISSITYILKKSIPNLEAEMISLMAIDKFGGEWTKFTITAPIILVASLVLFGLGKKIQIFEIDPAKASVLGINKNALRYIVSLCVILIATCCVYLMGPIAFIGILVPHLSRLILSNLGSPRKNMMLSIPLSIIILLVAQILTRRFYSNNLNLNVLISIIAGPIVIFQILRRSHD